MKYVQIIVDRALEQIDHPLTYAVPEGMELRPGQLVEVPLRAGIARGFVLETAEETDLEPERIKAVRRPVSEVPPLPEEMLRLADWLADRCHCTVAETLRLMLPPEARREQVREKTVRMVRLLNPAPEIPPRAVRQRELVEKLRAGDLPAGEVSAGALRALCSRGDAEIYEISERRRPHVGRARRPEPQPTRAQRLCEEELCRALENGGGRFLLHGVTGSGKTEVYIHLVQAALQKGKSAIVLVPEIALTPQMVSWFFDRFGESAAVLHSALSAGEKFDEWRRIRSGEARVVIGARSAVFAPAENLGAIIVDEEHESSYLSDRRPRYDAREVAWRRAEQSGAVLVLGSATPSISSYMRAMPGVRPENRLTLLELPERATGRPLPEVELVDMRRELELGNRSVLSGKLLSGLRDCLESGMQAMLLINRRGHSTFVNCRKCGYVVKCPQCDVSLTYHREDEALECHYCGHRAPVPTKCPECGSRFIKFFGAGTEKVVEEVRKCFPQARVLRMDRDTTIRKDAHARILEAFGRGEADILVGTQMIAKGLDFPRVTLVGVVAADMSLNVPDYRSAERTFQLITQVAGRAGRAQAPGRVLVQTYAPENYALQLAQKQDFRAFYWKESALRREKRYPPFTVILRVVFSGESEEKTRNAAQAAQEEMDAFLTQKGHMADVVQSRAVEAPVRRIRGQYRWQLFVKVYFKADISAIAGKMEELAERAPEQVRAELEINPTNLS